MVVQVKQPIPKELDSVRELSQRTGKADRTLHRAVRAGKIKTVRLGGSVMVPRREVDRILAQGY